MKKVAAIYARVSTSDGKQNYNRQIDELTEIAKKDGYTSIEVYAESISGFKKSDKRPELNKLLNKADADNKYFGCIYTAEVSRIGRDPSDTRKVIDKLSDFGVPIYIQSIKQSTLDSNGNRNGLMNIILQVLLEYSKMEAETFKIRSMSGARASVKAGKAGGSNFFPYGYCKDENGLLVVEESEAKVIKLIFDLYKKGNGTKVISQVLNEKNIPTRTKKIDSSIIVNWSDKQVHDILRNTIYKGDRRYKGEIFPINGIVSAELFDECTDIMKGKTHRNYLTTYTYLLKDICSCGVCKRNFFAKYKPVPSGDKVYICSSRLKKGGNCGNGAINISLIESAVYDIFSKSHGFADVISNSTEIKNNLQADIKRLEQQLKLDNKKLTDSDGRKERLLDLYVNEGLAKKTYLDKLQKLENEILALTDKVNAIEKEIREKKNAYKTFDKKTSSLKELFNKASREEIAAMFKQIINKIIINKVDDDNVLISINSIKGVVYLLLDTSGMKFRNKVYRYKYAQDALMKIKKVYDDGVMVADERDILKFFEKEMFQYEDIPANHILQVQ